MGSVVVVALVAMCVGCTSKPQDGTLSAAAGEPSIREQLQVPDGVMLCIVKYPTSVTSGTSERFHKSVLRLDGILAANNVQYNAAGFLANLYYVRSQQDKAKKLIVDAMKDEPYRAEFY